jgi:hypothetical protein
LQLPVEDHLRLVAWLKEQPVRSHVLLQAPMFTLPVNVLLAVSSTPPRQ